MSWSTDPREGGRIAYRYHGYYYIENVRQHGYPQVLGQHLVSQIPLNNPGAFQKWKEAKQEQLDRSYRYWREEKFAFAPTQFVPVTTGVEDETLSDISDLDLDNETLPETSKDGLDPDLARRMHFDESDKDGLDSGVFFADSRFTGQARSGWSKLPPYELELSLSWMYIIDLDRNFFSITERDNETSTTHFPLGTIPLGWLANIRFQLRRLPSHEEDYEFLYRPSDIYGLPPVDETLLKYYQESRATLIDAPVSVSTTPQSWILWGVQTMRNFFQLFKEMGYRDKFALTPEDPAMQRLVYELVKCCTWSSLSIHKVQGLENQPDDHPYQNWTWLWLLSERPNFETDAAYPTITDYFVPIGPDDQKVLISLAVGLDSEPHLQMAVAKVVNMIPDDQKLTACILSPLHVVIVYLDKRSVPPSIEHTAALPLWSVDDLKYELRHEPRYPGIGRAALTQVLSPAMSNRNRVAVNPCPLPPELLERIFESLFSLGGNTETISNFRRACQLFKAIVDDRTIRIPGLTLLQSPVPGRGYISYYYGLDDEGRKLFQVTVGGPKWKARHRAWAMGIDDIPFQMGILQFRVHYFEKDGRHSFDVY